MAGGAGVSKRSRPIAGGAVPIRGGDVIVRVHPSVIDKATVLAGDTFGPEESKFVTGRALTQGRLIIRRAWRVVNPEEKVREALASNSVKGEVVEHLEPGVVKPLVQHNNLGDCRADSGDANAAELVVDLGCPRLDVGSRDASGLGDNAKERKHIKLTLDGGRKIGNGGNHALSSHNVKSADVHLHMIGSDELAVDGHDFLDHLWYSDDANISELVLNCSHPGRHVVGLHFTGVSDASEVRGHGARTGARTGAPSGAHVDSYVALVPLTPRLNTRKEVLGSSLGWQKKGSRVMGVRVTGIRDIEAQVIVDRGEVLGSSLRWHPMKAGGAFRSKGDMKEVVRAYVGVLNGRGHVERGILDLSETSCKKPALELKASSVIGVGVGGSK
jgi:hypothetical protein